MNTAACRRSPSLRCVFTDRTLCFRAVGDGLVEVNTVASDVGSLLTVVNWRMNATKVTLHLDNSTGWLRPFTHVSLGSSGEPLPAPAHALLRPARGLHEKPDRHCRHGPFEGRGALLSLHCPLAIAIVSAVLVSLFL